MSSRIASTKNKRSTLDGESLIGSVKLHRFHGCKLVSHKVTEENAGAYVLTFDNGKSLVFTAEGLQSTCSMTVLG